MKHTCTGCGGESISCFYQVENVPAYSVVMMPTRQKALNCSRGDIVLGLCRTCGLVYNTALDPELIDYTSNYESTQGFSATYDSFARRLAGELVDRYGLRGKQIMEIGCGEGEFLAFLCELGDSRGIGFDPAYSSRHELGTVTDRVAIVKDFYSDKYIHHQADFICCRMTLEHIPQPAALLSTIRRSIEDRQDTVVFFQVPDVRRILREAAFWDIYYEHCSYFGPESLANLFLNCGFAVVDTWTDYDDQYLMVTARAAKEQPILFSPGEQAELGEEVAHFCRNLEQKLDSWRRTLLEIAQDGQRVVLWGGGSKAVAFLTTLDIRDQIEHVVDINPHKQGTYIAGTGQGIVAPSLLQQHKPDVVIVMNPIYRNEIESELSRMGLTPRILTV